ncbi:MAG TPA: glycosyl transferase [Planctomycetaceae bacterium]|nr:glycosyl transferase [Planctomycetaceae bacterium]HRF00662.1 glycosyltransferase family 2 protein [Pirellulaceae bacterium]
MPRVLRLADCEPISRDALPERFRLSVIVPVFNEARTIEQVMERLLEVPLPLEIVIVDDGSVDGTRALLAERIETWRTRVSNGMSLELVLHEANRGKGAALRTGFGQVSGEAVIIQDADLEYDPLEFLRLLRPLIDGRADVVYGSRYARGAQSDSPGWHRLGNRLITIASNLLTGCDWTDVETCYKLVRTPLVRAVAPTLRERGFGIELEMTAKLARQPGVRLCELPIAYRKRSYAEGKKIGLRDAFRAFWCIVRYRLKD